jgi:hypothetical protein
LFGVVEAGIETGGWTPELRASRASIDTSIDNLKRKMIQTLIDTRYTAITVKCQTGAFAQEV